jgi:hypothetical protein
MTVGQSRGWGICRNLNSTADLVKSAGDRANQGSGYRLHPKHLISWVKVLPDLRRSFAALRLPCPHILLSTVRGLLSGLALGPSVTSCIMLHILTAHRTMLFL